MRKLEQHRIAKQAMSQRERQLYNEAQLTAEKAHKIFYIKDGKLFWKIYKSRIYPGLEAGSWHGDGIQVGIDGILYLVHRIIYLMNYREWPKLTLDHKNGIQYENNINNLREATEAQNKMNTSLRADNTSGVKGVCWNKQICKWQANITINGKTIYLGIFNEFENAVKARIKAENKYFGEFRHNPEGDAILSQVDVSFNGSIDD